MENLCRCDIVNIDVTKSLMRSYVGIVLATGDNNANKYGVNVYKDGEPLDITGYSVLGHFIRPDMATLPIPGTAEGNTAYVELPAACYTSSGSFSLAIKISGTDITQTVRVVDGCIRQTQTDAVVDPGEVVPTLDDLFAKIADVEAAAAAAKEATAQAEEAAQNANTAEMKAADPVVFAVEGKSLTLTGAAENRRFQGLTVYGTSAQAAEPAPDAPVSVEGVTDPVVTLTDADGTVQTLDAAGVTLHGVQVTATSDGASYTDNNGAQWVADAVDFKRGKLIRRIGTRTFDGTETWTSYGTTTGTYRAWIGSYSKMTETVGRNAITTHFPVVADYADMYYGRVIGAYAGGANMGIGSLILCGDYATAEDLQTYLKAQYDADNPLVVYYVLKTPGETDLTAEQLETFAGLYSNPDMIITADAGAWLNVEYIANTKQYIDAAAEEASQYAQNAGYAEEADHAAESDHAAAADDCDTVRGVDVLAAMAELAGGIEVEASGTLVEITDAAARAARSLVSSIAAVQEGEGDPSPDNVRTISGWDTVQLWHGAALDEDADPALSAALPETVFGGSLDWTTGLLTVTHCACLLYTSPSPRD